MSEIILIAPDPETVQLAEKLDLHNRQVATIFARQQQGVAVAQAAVSAGAKVLISRGVTFRMILNAIPNTPVIEIPYTGYDILRARLAAVKRHQPLALAADRQVTAGLTSIEKILHLPPSILVNFDDADIEAAVIKAKNLGAATLIGSRAVVETAPQYGLAGVTLDPGQEGLEQAVLLATQHLSKQQSQEKAARQLETIINSINYGVLAIDHTGAVTTMNMEAARIFNLAKGGWSAAESTFTQKLWECMISRQRQTGMVEHIGRD
ncbi:MAG: PrpR N-terminal domain-containing protein, partial [Sporomusa sp.]